MRSTIQERFWTIPNALSVYRILIFPFILFLVVSGRESLFAVFITISLLTDILDGLIARAFDQKTKIGAKLDSWADLGTYVLAFYAICQFKWTEVREHATVFFVFLIFMIVSYAAVFVKFGGLIGLHTYMFKLTGYLQGAFIVSLFTWKFHVVPFYFCLVWGSIACLEEIIIIALLRRPASNVKGLYWMIKKKQFD